VTDHRPFAFTPQGGRLECSAFSIPFKALALAIVTLALAWGWRLWSNHLVEFTVQSGGWLIAALAMMLYTEWHILRGTTVLDAQAIRQSWVWNKQVDLQQLAYAKLIRLRGLEWLIAPRLYTKTFSGKLATFYAADSAMLAEFKRLEQELTVLRQQR